MGTADPNLWGLLMWWSSWFVGIGLAGWAFGLLSRRGE